MLGGNEAEKTMEMWEKSRKPRKVPADMDSISVPRSTLEGIISEDMKCPICLGTIDVTLTVTTCLHRFCTECLERSLRVNLGPKDHHDCPACRAKMASRRASKRDTRFDYLTTLFSVSTGRKPQSALDAVVDSMVVDEEDEVSPRNKRSQPAPDSYEDEDEEDFDFSQYQQAHESKVEQFRKRQRLLVANRGPLPAYTPSAPVTHTNSSSSKNKSRSSSNKARPEPVGPRVCLSLFPSFEGSRSTSIMSLSMPFLKVPPLMQIGDVKQFLNLKFSFSKEDFDLLEVFITHQQNTVILDDYLTISDVLMLYWDMASELRLYYRLYST